MDTSPPDASAHVAYAASHGWRFHHIGIIVRDLAAAAAMYGALGFGPGQTEEVPAQGVRVLLLPTGNPNQYLELITPLAEGALTRFLARRGEGIHHIAFAVDDITAALERLRADGVRLIDDAPR